MRKLYPIGTGQGNKKCDRQASTYGRHSSSCRDAQIARRTGSFASRLELQAKRLELLKDALPGVRRVAVFLAEGPRGNQAWRTALERTARELGVELHPVEMHGPDDVERALSALEHEQAEALVVSDAALLSMHAERIGDFIVKHRLPTIGASSQPTSWSIRCVWASCGAGPPSLLTRF